MESVLKTKELYLRMEIATKRAVYSCKNNFVTLASIKPWSQYCEDEKLQSSIPEEQDEKLFTPDEEINSKVSLWQGDITHLEIDAIVNAANESLLGGGGVDGCIHNAAGDELYDECKTLDGCESGSAKITGGYKLPAKYIIHAVGPIGEKPAVLKSAYEASFNLMLENQLRTIAFPCISTGIYGYPPRQAAHVALAAARNFMELHKDKVDRVIFATFLDSDKVIYEEFMQRYFPVEK